jgi:hypothetical protein
MKFAQRCATKCRTVKTFATNIYTVRFVAEYTRHSMPTYILNHYTTCHIASVPKCVVSGCRDNVLRYASNRHHFRARHPQIYKCLLGNRCEYGTQCKSALQHLHMFELHNSLVMDPLRPPFPHFEISDLVYTTHAYPTAVIQSRLDTARRMYELEHAPSPDSPYSGENMPTEIWYLIGMYVDANTLFTWTKTSHRLRYVAKTIMKYRPIDQFQYNFLKYVGDDIHLASVIHPSELRFRFMLIPDDLNCVVFQYQYTVKNVCEALCKKYSMSWTMYRTVVERRRELYDIEMAEKQKRKTDLTDALQVKGLDLRSDSSMCRNYIVTGCGVNGETLSDIVDIMHEMSWLYTNTNYSHYVDYCINEYRGQGEWYNKDVVVNAAKMRVTLSWFGRVGKTKTREELEALPTRVVAKLTLLGFMNL